MASVPATAVSAFLAKKSETIAAMARGVSKSSRMGRYMGLQGSKGIYNYMAVCRGAGGFTSQGCAVSILCLLWGSAGVAREHVGVISHQQVLMDVGYEGLPQILL